MAERTRRHNQAVLFACLQPELNPDELAKQDIKSNIFREGRAKDKPELMGKLRSFLRYRQRRPAKVQKYFEGKYVTYAKAV